MNTSVSARPAPERPNGIGTLPLVAGGFFASMPLGDPRGEIDGPGRFRKAARGVEQPAFLMYGIRVLWRCLPLDDLFWGRQWLLHPVFPFISEKAGIPPARNPGLFIFMDVTAPAGACGFCVP